MGSEATGVREAVELGGDESDGSLLETTDGDPRRWRRGIVPSRLREPGGIEGGKRGVLGRGRRAALESRRQGRARSDACVPLFVSIFM